jgi:hypothetical protein
MFFLMRAIFFQLNRSNRVDGNERIAGFDDVSCLARNHIAACEQFNFKSIVFFIFYGSSTALNTFCLFFCSSIIALFTFVRGS